MGLHNTLHALPRANPGSLLRLAEPHQLTTPQGRPSPGHSTPTDPQTTTPHPQPRSPKPAPRTLVLPSARPPGLLSTLVHTGSSRGPERRKGGAPEAGAGGSYLSSCSCLCLPDSPRRRPRAGWTRGSRAGRRRRAEAPTCSRRRRAGARPAAGAAPGRPCCRGRTAGSSGSGRPGTPAPRRLLAAVQPPGAAPQHPRQAPALRARDSLVGRPRRGRGARAREGRERAAWGTRSWGARGGRGAGTDAASSSQARLPFVSARPSPPRHKDPGPPGEGRVTEPRAGRERRPRPAHTPGAELRPSRGAIVPEAGGGAGRGRRSLRLAGRRRGYWRELRDGVSEALCEPFPRAF